MGENKNKEKGRYQIILPVAQRTFPPASSILSTRRRRRHRRHQQKRSKRRVAQKRNERRVVIVHRYNNKQGRLVGFVGGRRSRYPPESGCYGHSPNIPLASVASMAVAWIVSTNTNTPPLSIPLSIPPASIVPTNTAKTAPLSVPNPASMALALMTVPNPSLDEIARGASARTTTKCVVIQKQKGNKQRIMH